MCLDMTRKFHVLWGWALCLLLILIQQDDFDENFSFGINVLGHGDKVSCFGEAKYGHVCVLGFSSIA